MRQIIYQNQKDLKKAISEVYLEAFPEEERPPVHYFFKCLGNRMGILGCSTAEMKMSLGC